MTNTTLTSHLNTVQETTYKTTIMALIIVTPVCVATFILNAFALIVMSKSQKLKKNKFYRLTLYLSISDIISSISSFSLIINMILELCAIKVSVICFGSTLLSSFTITFSMVQVLLICIERLIATFPVVNCAKWTFQKSLIFVLILSSTAVYTSCIHFWYGDIGSVSCEMKGIFGADLWKFQLSIGIVHIILFVAILAMYAAVFYRIFGKINAIQKLKIRYETSQSRSTKSKYKKIEVRKARNNSDVSLENRIRKSRHAFYTLGIIIGLMTLSDLVPVTFHLISAISEDKVSNNLLKFTNGLFIINPLCDPIIYVFRIKEYRHTLKRMFKT